MVNCEYKATVRSDHDRIQSTSVVKMIHVLFKVMGKTTSPGSKTSETGCRFMQLYGNFSRGLPGHGKSCQKRLHTIQ